MPEVPPIGDPRRPLHLAIRSMRLLGLLFVLLGLCLMIAWMAARPGTARATSWLLVLLALVYFIPGVLYVVFAIFLGRRQPWAVVGGMVVATCSFCLRC